jgi:pilus assembly protein Flp/PilA
MKAQARKLAHLLQSLLVREHGQDLVEYALVLALIAFGATAGMQSLAAGINTAFNGLSTTMGTYVS